MPEFHCSATGCWLRQAVACTAQVCEREMHRRGPLRQRQHERHRCAGQRACAQLHIAVPPACQALPSPAPLLTAAAVVEVCGAGPVPACGPGDVLLNSFAFRQLAARPALAANAFPAEWRFVPCGPWGQVYQGKPTPGGAAGQMGPPQRAAAVQPGSSALLVPAAELAAEPARQAASPGAMKSQQAPTPAPLLAPEAEGTAATTAAPSFAQPGVGAGAGRPAPLGEPARAAPGNVSYAANGRLRPVANSAAVLQPARGEAGAASQPEVVAFAAPLAPLAEVGHAVRRGGLRLALVQCRSQSCMAQEACVRHRKALSPPSARSPRCAGRGVWRGGSDGPRSCSRANRRVPSPLTFSAPAWPDGAC